ncbi:MAG: family N-acetyltransferase [Sediminibacterium sp.]|nr:family N-acetyltransferase [Sediminibacterium sp.]
MENPLDNPVWNALVTGNSLLAKGSERVKFFDKQVSPFAALIDNTPANFQELYEASPSDHPTLLWTSEPVTIPQPWVEVDCLKGFQMVYDQPGVMADPTAGITPLTEKNVPEMLALTKLTRPGPFGSRTIEFGNYEGIFEDGQLVAMTGQRFHCGDHIEVSAVCTHPSHVGKGYAKQLLRSQIRQMLASSAKPYLHVKGDNERAIHVYKTLGFSIRIPVCFYVIKKS